MLILGTVLFGAATGCGVGGFQARSESDPGANGALIFSMVGLVVFAGSWHSEAGAF